MEYKYIWNSKCNSFEPYEPEYETVIEKDENGEDVERSIEKEPTCTLYSKHQVDSIFANRGAHQVIKDVDGVPTAVDLYTPQEIAAKERVAQIAALKAKLDETDYKAIKYAEGLISEADYLPIKIERQEYRNQINELEAQA